MKIRFIKLDARCMYAGCDRTATHIAAIKEDAESGMYCEEHALEVAAEYAPDNIVACPNCDCLFGIYE